MKRIGLLTREKIVEEIQKRLEEAEACFFVNFSKVDAFSLNLLRNDLRKNNASLFVSKDTLFRRAFQNCGYQDLNGLLENETGIVFVYDKDIVKASKIVVDFSKEHENFKIKGGFLGKDKITSEQLAAIAKLPSKEVILAMATSAIASPLTGFLVTLNNIILQFLWLIEEIKKKKESS
jgi:large subunit ribosomal protein L10